MLKKDVKIQAKVGLHARPASMVVKAATKYKSDIEIHLEGKIAIAKSMISVLALGVACDDKVELVINGIDEEKAMEELYTLMSSTFGE